MKKIAIPATGNTLSSHFGHCDKFAIYDTDNGTIKKEDFITPPNHQPGVYPKWLKEQGVTDVIAGGIGQRAIQLFNQQGINVCVGAPLKAAEELVKDYISGNLESKENYCDH
jgi:predicted Fe-Mo cluster-binding NifX family protein